MNTWPVERMARVELSVATSGKGLIGLTDRVAAAVADSGLTEGMAQLFARHTSCSLIISENADPAVCGDLERYFERLVVDGDALFQHREEGPDDMSAHVRTVLTGVSLSIPIRASRLGLGTWQGIFLWEHRTSPHQRQLDLTLIGR